MEDTLVQNFQQFIKQAQNEIENKLKDEYQKKEQDLRKHFEQRERDLDHDEQNLEKRIEEYNTMKTRITTIIKGRSKIKLNIGGKIFITSIHNITSDKESMFSGMFSEEFHPQPDEDGEYFIDRNPGRFDIILEHLRGHDVKTLIAQLSNEERQTLQKDVDYYNVQSLFEHFPMLNKNISNMIASGSYDKTIRMWDITSGQCIKTLTGHTDTVCSIIQLNNGNIASGSSDKTIRVWDITSGQCIKTLTGHTDAVFLIIQLNNKIL
jgi:WD40 repeat protein